VGDARKLRARAPLAAAKVMREDLEIAERPESRIQQVDPPDSKRYVHRFDHRALTRRQEPRYRGPGRLLGPDSHRPAAVSLSLGYVMTTVLPVKSAQVARRTFRPSRPGARRHPPTACTRSSPMASRVPISSTRRVANSVEVPRASRPAYGRPLQRPKTRVGDEVDVGIDESGPESSFVGGDRTSLVVLPSGLDADDPVAFTRRWHLGGGASTRKPPSPALSLARRLAAAGMADSK
jgi:hypothetical protein